MFLEFLLIVFGIALLAKHQCAILRYRYKQANICPERLFPDGSQCYQLTKLAEECPVRPTVFIPVLDRRVKLPLHSEIAGTLIIFGCLYWSWNYSTNFPYMFSIALGGVSWVYITKYAMTVMLKQCNRPSVKLVAIAIMVYPLLLIVFYVLIHLLVFFNIIYDRPYLNGLTF